MRRAAYTLDAQQLLGGEVAEILRDLAAVQRVQQGGVVHQLPAGIVQHTDAVLAHSQRLGVDRVAGRGQVGDMDGQVVAAGQHIAQRDTVLHTAGEAPCGVDRNVGVIAEDLHAQRHGGIGHPGADGTQTNDAQRLAAQLRADKYFFALFHILGDGVAPLEGLRPVDSIDQIAAARHQRADDQLCHGVGCTLDAVDFSGNAVTDLAEQIIFQTIQLILGIQDSILQFLKLRIRITFRIR